MAVSAIVKNVVSMIKASPVVFLVSLLVSYFAFIIFGSFSGPSDYEFVAASGEIDYAKLSAGGFSLFSIFFYLVYNYFIISRLILKNKTSSLGVWKTIKSVFALSAIFFLWFFILVCLFSMCIAYIPEFNLLFVDGAIIHGLVSGVDNPSSIAFINSLWNINVFNSIVSIFVFLTGLFFCYFGLITSAVIYAKTNKFRLSLFCSPRFIVGNVKSYLFVLLPLAFASIVFLYFDINVYWILSVVFSYVIVSMFNVKVNP